jgi:hypothetical protein
MLTIVLLVVGSLSNLMMINAVLIEHDQRVTLRQALDELGMY